MSIEEAVAWYAGVFCVLLVPLVWFLYKRIADKRRNTAAVSASDGGGGQRPRKSIDWSAVLALRPHKVLSGDMWLKAVIAAFVALCVGVTVVVFVFPLGAGFSAVASFATVALLVLLFLLLMD
ncbi:MAG TPA: hypothetical protein VH985_23145 [Candidatus Binatia bacterium]|jgi:hypothetical protein